MAVVDLNLPTWSHRGQSLIDSQRHESSRWPHFRGRAKEEVAGGRTPVHTLRAGFARAGPIGRKHLCVTDWGPQSGTSTYFLSVSQRFAAQNDKPERGAAVAHWQHGLHEGLHLAAVGAGHQLAEDAQRILVERDKVLVLEDSLELGPYGAQVVAHKQRRSPHAPDGHLGARLRNAQAEVADDQLVWVEPVART